MDKKKQALNEFYRLSGQKINESFHNADGIPIGTHDKHMPIKEDTITEGGRQETIEAINMLVSHLYNVDQSLDTNKAYEVLSKNPGLVNLLPLSPEDIESLNHLSTVFKDNDSNEKLQEILKIVKSYVNN